MKKLLLVIFFLLASGTCRAGLQSGPDHTILLSSFDDVMIVDSFAVGIATKGVTVLEYNSDSSLFEFRNQLFLNFTSATMKRFGDTLVVFADSRRLYFIDMSALPSLTILGTVDMGSDFADFAIHNSDLYISKWFQGVWRYRLDGYSEAAFVDSSMTGILVSQLDVSQDTLYVLDEYNGVLRYDISGSGFGRFIDYLYVPFRVSSFVQYDSLFCLLLNSGGVYFGDFDADGGQIVDSIPGIPTPLRAYKTNRVLLVLTQRQMYEIDRSDFSRTTVVDIQDNKLNGDLFEVNSDQYIVLPGVQGGLSMFNVNTGGPPLQGLYRAGLVSDIYIYHHTLFTSGPSNPVDAWQLGDSAGVRHDYAILPDIDNTSHMAHNGDSLIVEYPDYDKVGVVLNSLNPDSLSLENTFDVGGNPIRSLQLARNRVHKFEMLVVDRPDYLDPYLLADSGYVTHISHWTFVDQVVTSAVVDTFLYVVLEKRELLVYAIRKDFTLTYLADFGLFGITQSMFARDSELYVFGTDRVSVLDITNPLAIRTDTVISVPMRVLDAQESGDSLYAVGPDGIAIFDLSSGYPSLVDHGGLGGNTIAAEDGFVAVTGGNGVYIYNLAKDSAVPPSGNGQLPKQFVLSQNYPNPFNPTTMIRFDLISGGHTRLQIFNILGQLVATPVDADLSAGMHGLSFDGSHLASGIYFYRMTVGSSSDTKKMMLVK